MSVKVVSAKEQLDIMENYVAETLMQDYDRVLGMVTQVLNDLYGRMNWELEKLTPKQEQDFKAWMKEDA